MEAAAPKVEKAAVSAGKVLGKLRAQAKETAKGFSEGYQSEPDERPAGQEPSRKRPRPGPAKD
jgi:hypothetical protein